jgi:hypothetical protein
LRYLNGVPDQKPSQFRSLETITLPPTISQLAALPLDDHPDQFQELISDDAVANLVVYNISLFQRTDFKQERLVFERKLKASLEKNGCKVPQIIDTFKQDRYLSGVGTRREMCEIPVFV